MFMSGVESNCEGIFCPKYGDRVDLKTCMLCPYYRKFLLKSRCCWKIEHVADFLGKVYYKMPVVSIGEK